jgi:2-polyprenyl-3-methyl-5-hydroxy-6-metoxy-1,4-benzoquinol methylase
MTTTQDLENIAFSSFDNLNARVLRFRYERLSQHYRGRSCLELGCADGAGTELLADHFAEVVAVDGSALAIRRLHNAGRRNVQGIHALFEDLDLGRDFETVLLGHILEHVDDPQAVLTVARRHLSPNGVLIADVPNGASLHRQLGVELGLMHSPTDLNEADRSIGHQRVYLPQHFRAEFVRAGLREIAFGGFFLKPFSNGQLESWLSDEQQDALFRMGERYPELAAEIYVVAEHVH